MIEQPLAFVDVEHVADDLHRQPPARLESTARDAAGKEETEDRGAGVLVAQHATHDVGVAALDEEALVKGRVADLDLARHAHGPFEADRQRGARREADAVDADVPRVAARGLQPRRQPVAGRVHLPTEQTLPRDDDTAAAGEACHQAVSLTRGARDDVDDDTAHHARRAHEQAHARNACSTTGGMIATAAPSTLASTTMPAAIA